MKYSIARARYTVRHWFLKLRNRRRFFFSIGALMLVVGSIFVFYVFSNLSFIQYHAPALTVSFLNIGQGDSILIETKVGTTLLVDGGKDKHLLRELGAVFPFSKKKIDLVLATHPDMDHIGGLPFIFPFYRVGEFLYTGAKADHQIDELLEGIMTRNGARTREISKPERITLDAENQIYADILFPDRSTEGWETNSASIVVRIVYGKTSFLLTGDLPISGEEYLVSRYGEALQSTVLKLGHHGSRTSSAEVFLKKVVPKYGIVSAGKDNDYGHPHREVLDRVKDATKAQILETKNGRVVCESDGERVDCENER